MMFILLVCSSGMSTSLVVSHMKKAAQAQGKEYRILATSVDNAYEYYADADVILLGPQIAAYEEQIQKESKKTVAVMDRLSYGGCKGEKILNDAEELYAVSCQTGSNA